MFLIYGCNIHFNNEKFLEESNAFLLDLRYVLLVGTHAKNRKFEQKLMPKGIRGLVLGLGRGRLHHYIVTSKCQNVL